MAIISFIFVIQKGRFDSLEKRHFFKIPRDNRGLEVAKS